MSSQKASKQKSKICCSTDRAGRHRPGMALRPASLNKDALAARLQPPARLDPSRSLALDLRPKMSVRPMDATIVKLPLWR